MRHPKRRLQEFLDNSTTPARAAAVQAHLARCGECRAEAARERRRQSRLRSAEIPVPSPELRERIERTALHGAGQSTGQQGAGRQGAGQQGTGKPGTGKQGTRRRFLVTAGAMAAVGLVLSTAYVLGGWTHSPALAASAPGLAAGWSEVTGDEDRQLTAEQIDALRTRGWTCPELRRVGMTLVTAHSVHVAGQPAVAMTLEGEDGTVTVYETRSDGSARGPAIDGMSGHLVTDEGFVLQEAAPGRPEVWRHPLRPHHAVVTSGRVTYSIAAAAADDRALEDAVSELSLTESSRLVRHLPDTAQGVWDRIRRGLSVMTGAGVRL